jgi:hypothetical protein
MNAAQPNAMKRFSPTVIALVLANLIPLYGVLALGWEVFPLMLLFWMENVIIGVFNVLRMLLAELHKPAAWVGKLFLVPFFCVHYGMFTFVHGVFVVGLFGGQFRAGASFPSLGMFQKLITEQHLGIAVLALVASHAFSFAWNYLWRGEYRTVALQTLMARPYARVVVLHLVILGSGFLLVALKSPVVGLVLLVLFKIGLDVSSHLKEHVRLADTTATTTVSQPTRGESFPRSS